MSERNFLRKVAEHITRETHFVPLEGTTSDRYGHKYGLIYPFIHNHDVYYSHSLDHGTRIIENKLRWYASHHYGVSEDEIYDLITEYRKLVFERIELLQENE